MSGAMIWILFYKNSRSGAAPRRYSKTSCGRTRTPPCESIFVPISANRRNVGSGRIPQTSRQDRQRNRRGTCEISWHATHICNLIAEKRCGRANIVWNAGSLQRRIHPQHLRPLDTGDETERGRRDRKHHPQRDLTPKPKRRGRRGAPRLKLGKTF